MGQEELVLKIPASDPVPPSIESKKQSAISSSDSSGEENNGSKKQLERTNTHSRESSGASVKFVNINNNNGHRRTLSKSGGGSHVIILQTPSDDVTISDRLSSTQDEEEFDLDEEEELKTGCEDDFHDRLSNTGEYTVDALRMHRKNDSKSQNSDYGSFCNTPSDTFAAGHGQMVAGIPSNEVVVGAAAANNRVSDSDGAGAAEGGGVAGGGNAEGGEEPDNANHTGDGTMPHESYQTEPLLNPNLNQDSCSSDDEIGANSSGYTRRKSRHPQRSVAAETRIDIDSADAAVNNTENDREIPAEPLKTFLAFLFLFLAWVATTTSLALTHERVPVVDPLPDVILDNVTYQGWGLDASEIIIMVATMAAFLLALFHQHRFVILRRIFFLAGIHYFYRAITMYITVLPKADPNYQCAAKLENNITVVAIANRVAKLLSGMGLSINGQHVYCGDYIYSGHTMTLLVTYLVIREYSPKKWFLLHWLSFCTTVTGVLTLLFARGHYSIDVLIAYWITTRLWWIYHTLANNQTLTCKENKHNYLDKFWWFVIFRYFECNVGRPLPKGFNWPIPQFVIDRIPWLRNRLNNPAARTNNSNDDNNA